MQEIDEIFTKAADKDAAGELKFGEAVLFGFYRLLEGEHAGRIVIKCSARIDGQPVSYFAKPMTWIYNSAINDVRCERAYPTFNEPRHEVDRSQATWYNDNSDAPQGYQW